MGRVYGHNVLRDEEFQPKLFSQAVPESEMHGQGSGAIIENTQDATAELLAEYEQSYVAEDTAKYGSQSPEKILSTQLEKAKQDLHQEYGRNPALVKRLSELWGAETNDCGVAVENVEKIVLIENTSLHAEINLYETLK